MKFSYNDRYVKIYSIDEDNNEIYYLFDMENEESPLSEKFQTEDELNNEIEEEFLKNGYSIDSLSDWIITEPMPEGAIMVKK